MDYIITDSNNDKLQLVIEEEPVNDNDISEAAKSYIDHLPL